MPQETKDIRLEVLCFTHDDGDGTIDGETMVWEAPRVVEPEFGRFGGKVTAMRLGELSSAHVTDFQINPDLGEHCVHGSTMNSSNEESLSRSGVFADKIPGEGGTGPPGIQAEAFDCLNRPAVG